MIIISGHRDLVTSIQNKFLSFYRYSFHSWKKSLPTSLCQREEHSPLFRKEGPGEILKDIYLLAGIIHCCYSARISGREGEAPRALLEEGATRDPLYNCNQPRFKTGYPNVLKRCFIRKAFWKTDYPGQQWRSGHWVLIKGMIHILFPLYLFHEGPSRSAAH